MPSASPVRFLTRPALALAFVTASAAAQAQEDAPPPAAPSAPSGGTAAPPPAVASAPSGGTASAPPAAAAAGFGVAGAWVISVQSYNAGGATPSFFFVKQANGDSSVLIQPGVDYFIGNGISVGGVVGVAHSSGSTTVNLGARAGFNQEINEHVSFWPTIGIDGSYNQSTSTSNSSAALGVFAPFLYHVAPHFFVGAGPFLSYLVKGGPGTQYGLDLVIGGWL